MSAAKKGLAFRLLCSFFVYIGLLGLGLCWIPVATGMVLLAYGCIGWGWAVMLMVAAPIVMVVGGALAWMAGGMGRSTL